MKLSEHLALSRQERQKHLDLSTPCELPEDCPSGRRYRLKRDLLKLLGLENDVPSWRKRGASVQLTHQCEHHSRNGLCCNPLHVSFGTGSENCFDMSSETRKKRGAGSAAKRLKDTLVSLTDGFVGSSWGVVGHAKTLGHNPNLKLKLTSEEVFSLTPLFEEFSWKEPRHDRPGKFRTKKGLRVPLQVLETLKIRVKI